MDEKELLKKAHHWFTITYEQTAEQAGLNCIKIWYKPIMKRDFKIYKFPEVVFGPSEKEVNALIRTQSLIRWGIIATILLLLLGMLILIGSLLGGKIVYLFWVAGGMGCCGVVFLILALYCAPLQKIWEGKIITYME